MSRGRARAGMTGAMLLVAALTLAGCGETEPTAAEPPEQTPVDTTEPTADEPEPADDEPLELPGELIDWGPQEGAVLAVVGVAADDVLNLREGPGVDFDVVREVDPLETEVVATGANRQIGDRAVWVEATVDDVTGWVSYAYLGYLADTDDITYQISDAGGSDYQEAAEAALEQLYPDVSDLTVTVVDGPHDGDPGDITLDVLGFADDSVMGSRLHVFGTPDGGRITVRTVEMTPICARGVSDGLCL